MARSLMSGDELDLFERSVGNATANHSGEALDAALDDLGWIDAFAADARTAVSILFEQQGASNATSSALDLVVAAALDIAPVPPASVVLPPFGSSSAPGEVVGEGLAVRGIATAALSRRDTVVVVAPTGGEHVIVVIDPADLTLQPIRGIDPAIGLVEVTGNSMRATTRSTSRPGGWDDAVAAGRRAIAHELLGASRAMLRLARDHAVERIQFGRPISSFQAVRHRLAESHVAIEASDAALDAAWDGGSSLHAALAKALAGRGARTTARHAQQVLAGIGFTAEHPFHRYLRRVLVLDGLLGSSASLTRELGDEILRTRQVPRTVAL